MTPKGPLVHCVRDFGGVTEPFIEQRLSAGIPGAKTELWFERTCVDPMIASRRIVLPAGSAGSKLDRILHRAPALGTWRMGPYGHQERLAKPQLIHAHYGTTGFWVGAVTTAPLVVSMYGFDVSVLPRRRAWRAAYRHLAERASIFLVEGPHMRGTLVDLGFPPSKVVVLPIATVVPDGDEPSGEGPTRRARAAGDTVRLLACGRLVEKKGHDIAVRAFARIRTQLPTGTSLEIVGGGPMLESLRGLAASVGVADTVRFLGPLPRAAFRDRLARADLFLAPSRTASNGDSEGGAPTTILDAQAMGTVVVASDHADIPFLVQDGVTGFVAAQGSVDALSAAILRALDNQSVWPRIRAAARAVIMTRHAPEATSATLRTIYSDLLAESEGAGIHSDDHRRPLVP